ncbi:hypothetical protein Q428_04785 [Fervidicella metallireducens AeB]|uniref:Uncharacterized protein n=1 Tax=Fervidicella metallireducens AeB TaxID=1403537 RepID=A0A017RYF9_9CLOT|nr:hypothetical protein [Fervidicella metallireducens]EYE88970.1 hypothetical protein Q428_04785 [Fervidicella metallireducens AeB]
MTENKRHKAANRENKRNDMNRPKDIKNNKQTPKRYEDFEGNKIE